MVITVLGKEYELRFDFEATEYKDFVDRMFKIVTMSYIAEETNDKTSEAVAMLNGSARLMSDLPETCKMGFYAGLLAKYNFDIDESYELLKTYMKENKLSWFKLYTILREAMEEDGFFDLTGMNEFLQMSTETQTEKKIPQDHKKSNRGRKSTTIK